MNNSRRTFILWGSLGIAGEMLGCATPKVLEKKTYTEEVSSVLISEDKKILVIMTKDYHYIFEAPSVIVKTLESSFHKNISGSLDSFYVDSSGVTTGKYNLLLGKNASEREQEKALRSGYSRNSVGVIAAAGELKGKRYRAGGIQDTSTSIKLNRTYKIYVTEESSSVRTISLTPITESAKGVLVIAAIPLFAIGLLFVCLLALGQGGCKS